MECKVFQSSIWTLRITKISFVILLLYFGCMSFTFFIDDVNWLSWAVFNAVVIMWIVFFPMFNYFYLTIEEKQLIFGNRYLLFGITKKYDYSEILKITVWSPLAANQSIGFRVHVKGKKRNWNYYSVGLLRHDQLKEVVNLLVEKGVRVEAIEK